MDTAPDPAVTALTGALPFLLIAAALIALPASLVLLALYRRAVVRLMSARTSGTAPAGPGAAPAGPWPSPDRAGRSPPAPGEAAARLLARAVRAPRRLAAVYAMGGVGYALFLTACWYAAASIDLSIQRFAVTFWSYLWPAALSVVLVAVSSGRGRARVVMAYAAVLALLGVVTMAEPRYWYQVFLVWMAANALPTLLLLAFLHRRVRAVGPLVFAFAFVATLGAELLLTFVGASDQRLRFAVGVGSGLGLGAPQLFVALVLTGIAAFGVLGWVVVRWVRVRYERKQASDQSILLDALWIVFAVSHSLFLAFEGVAWILAAPAAFLVYKILTRAGFSLLGRRSGPGAGEPTLLLLRVFSLGRRSERLYDTITMHWRHIGSIRLIAGPDLATTTIEPHEFLDFLTRRLAHRFVDGPAALERSVAEMDHAPDQDGRFRVNEFFCRDDSWKPALARLVDSSDAVLMDLRGFSDRNAGCRYELEALVDMAPLAKVVLVTDRTTRADFLDEVVRGAWRRLRPDSPNHGARAELMRRVSVEEESRAGEELLAVLCAAAQSGPLPVPAA